MLSLSTLQAVLGMLKISCRKDDRKAPHCAGQSQGQKEGEQHVHGR